MLFISSVGKDPWSNVVVASTDKLEVSAGANELLSRSPPPTRSATTVSRIPIASIINDSKRVCPLGGKGETVWGRKAVVDDSRDDDRRKR